MIAQPVAEKLASRMLAHHGIAFIWDAHVAAAAAYGLGNVRVASSLTAMAEAAEREWLRRETVAGE
jgi:hypothetical protein